MICYHHGFLLKKHEELVHLPNGRVACTKKHHIKASKELARGGEEADGGGRKGNWDCDGKNGPDDPHTSVQILIDWWSTEGNYSQFCGKHNNGIKKIQFCARLAQKMSNETTSTRDAKNVLSKIQHIERTFKDAHQFATSETGAGLQENDSGSFEEAVKKKCLYYYDILEVMSDRASSKPKATSYDLEDEDILGRQDDDDVSDISETEKSTITKRTAGTTATTSSKKAKRSSYKKNTALLNEDAIEALAKASKTSEAKMMELKRHHEFLERLEERKLELEQKREERESNSWKGKSDELDYKMQLLRRYNELKLEHEWSDEQIISFYPDMKQIVQAKK